MNRINIYILTLFLMVLGTSAIAQKNLSLELPYPSYKILIPNTLTYDLGDKRLSIISGIKPLNTKSKSFGIEYLGEPGQILSQPMIELFDADTKKNIKTISVQEYFGTETENWKISKGELVLNDSLQATTFLFSVKGQQFKFQKKIEKKHNPSLPLGKSLVINFALSAQKQMNVGIRLNLQYSGVAKVERNIFSVGDTLKSSKEHSAIVISADRGAVIKVHKKAQTGERKRITVQTDSLSVMPEQYKSLLSFQVVGTTVELFEQVENQTRNLFAYFLSGKTVPELAATAMADKYDANTGDTVTYTTIYNNIGTAPAVGININNPIPAGTKYIEKSAEGVGSKIIFSSHPDESSEFINWEFDESILPGDSRIISYKVIVL